MRTAFLTTALAALIGGSALGTAHARLGADAFTTVGDLAPGIQLAHDYGDYRGRDWRRDEWRREQWRREHWRREHARYHRYEPYDRY